MKENNVGRVTLTLNTEKRRQPVKGRFAYY
jgi:hypothetical protein